MKKLRMLIGKLLLRGTEYEIKSSSSWERGYIRFFNIIWYPKEGWINTFHNFDENDFKDLPRILNDVFADEVYGDATKHPWGIEIQKVKKTLKRRKRKNEK